MEFTSELFLAAKPEAVWTAITEIESWHKWMPNLVRVERLTGGDFGEGTAWRETRKMFGREASEHFLVTAAERPRSLNLVVDGSKGSTGKGMYYFDYSLGDVPAGTMLRLHGRIVMPGFFAGVMMKMFGGAMKKACEKDLHALKKFVEPAPQQAIAARP